MRKTLKKKKEIIELSEATGVESEKAGIKAVKELGKLEEKEAADKLAREMEQLDTVRKNNKEYRENLLYLIHAGMSTLDWPENYQWGVWFDGKGIIAAFIDPDMKKHYKAFSPSYVTKYDHQACERLVYFCEDYLDLHEPITSSDPIWTPPKNS